MRNRSPTHTCSALCVPQIPQRRLSKLLTAMSPGPQDIPVVHTHAVANFVSDRLLTVITDTRGVMQLKAYHHHDEVIEDLVINTEDD